MRTVTWEVKALVELRVPFELTRQAVDDVERGAEDSDFRAVADGYISVTPLTLDLTHLKMLDEAKLWWSEP